MLAFTLGHYSHIINNTCNLPVTTKCTERANCTQAGFSVGFFFQHSLFLPYFPIPFIYLTPKGSSSSFLLAPNLENGPMWVFSEQKSYRASSIRTHKLKALGDTGQNHPLLQGPNTNQQSPAPSAGRMRETLIFHGAMALQDELLHKAAAVVSLKQLLQC